MNNNYYWARIDYLKKPTDPIAEFYKYIIFLDKSMAEKFVDNYKQNTRYKQYYLNCIATGVCIIENGILEPYDPTYEV